jgi:hypothetical protein
MKRTFFRVAFLCLALSVSAMAADVPLRVVAEAGKVTLVPDVPSGTPVELKVVGNPPTFTVVIATYQGGKLSLSIVPVTIGGAQPVIPVEPLTGTALLVQQWSADVPADVRVPSALRLAASFESLAAKIGAGVLKTPKEIVTEAQASNKEALAADRDKWSGVMEKLRVHLNAEAAAGRLSSSEQHRLLFMDIAKGLRRVQ